MAELTMPPKNQEEALTDVVESTALQKNALAQLINAQAEKMKTVTGLDDITLDKLTEFQESVEKLMQTNIEMQKLLQEDLNYAAKATLQTVDSEVKEVLEVEEEVEEEVIDGKKTVKKIITKRKRD